MKMSSKQHELKLKKSCCKNSWACFKEYCNSTSIHGLRYIGDNQRTLCERIWWILVFLICFIGCLFSIHRVYLRWEQNAVVINLANRETSIAAIPFPTVTICPESKVVSYNLRKYKKFEYATKQVLCQNRVFMKKKYSFDYEDVKNYTQFDNDDQILFSSIDEAKPGFYPCGPRNYLKNVKFYVSFDFDKILIDEGICYSSNLLSRDQIFKENVYHPYDTSVTKTATDWSVETGYRKSADIKNDYPRRAAAPYKETAKGVNYVIFTLSDDINGTCVKSSTNDGYRVFLHAPMNIPFISNNYFRLGLNHSASVSVKPTVITTSNALRKYNTKIRGCYFQNERHLKFFKIYTSNNCKMECLTNFTLHHCNCVNFFMPRDNITAICTNRSSLVCTEEAIEKMQLNNLREELEDTEYDGFENCNCLPSCSDLSYETEMSQNNFHLTNDIDIDVISQHVSSISVYFKSDTFIKLERSEFYGPIDFLANFGGLFGLFIGFSIISLIEILYFLTIRIFCEKCK